MSSWKYRPFCLGRNVLKYLELYVMRHGGWNIAGSLALNWKGYANDIHDELHFNIGKPIHFH